MLKLSKKLLSLLLAVTLLASLFLVTASANQNREAMELSAHILYELGLFRGVGNDKDGNPVLDLDRAPTREEAAVMLVRLLGKETEALAKNHSSPFTDVSGWAKPYIGYAYQNQFTNGMSENYFGAKENVTPAQYLTFVLRALGYNANDFHWQTAWDLTNELRITSPGTYDASTTNFIRGDIALISSNALNGKMKNSSDNLLAYLNKNGALADTNMVLFDVEAVTHTVDGLQVAFFPITGSPNNYASFRVNKATVNGQNCTLKQYTTQQEVAANIGGLSSLYPTAFNYSFLGYDYDAACNAAEHSYEPGDGKQYPVLEFAFDCTGTLPDGTSVQEVFSYAIYVSQ